MLANQTVYHLMCPWNNITVVVYSVCIMLFFWYVNVKRDSEYQASRQGEGPGDEAIYQYMQMLGQIIHKYLI